MDELKEKHRTGANDIDDPDRAPTGAPYRQVQEQQQAAAAARRQQQEEQENQHRKEQEERENLRAKFVQKEHDGTNENDDDVLEDDEFEDLLEDDNDPVLEAIRLKRLHEMKQAHMKHAENIAKGHVQYRTITQDELLPECTGSSEWVAIHLFHSDFQRCQIMDFHLKQIALRHITCKFLRIDAEKAPFFVSKLVIRTLPTLIVFRDGKAVNRLTGFEGLTTAADLDNFPTSKLQSWLAETGAVDYDISKDEFMREELLQEEQRSGRHGRAIWSTAKQFNDLEI